MFCKKCGKNIGSATVCPSCGYSDTPQASNPNEKFIWDFLANNFVCKLSRFISKFMIFYLIGTIIIRAVNDQFDFFSDFYAFGSFVVDQIYLIRLFIFTLVASLITSFVLSKKLKPRGYSALASSMNYLKTFPNYKECLDKDAGMVWQGIIFAYGDKKQIASVILHNIHNFFGIILKTTVLTSFLDDLVYYIYSVDGVFTGSLSVLIVTWIIYSIARIIITKLRKKAQNEIAASYECGVYGRPAPVAPPPRPQPQPRPTVMQQPAVATSGSKSYSEEDLKAIYGDDYDLAEVEKELALGKCDEETGEPIPEPTPPPKPQTTYTDITRTTPASTYSAPIQNTYTSTQAQNTQIGMKWYKFTIYFALWASAISYFLSSLMQFSGNIVALGFGMDDIYFTYPELKTIDLIYGFMMLLLGIYTLRVRGALAKFKKKAPSSLTRLLILQMVISLMYSVYASALISLPASSFINFPSIIANIALIIYNIVYYSKRKTYFVH